MHDGARRLLQDIGAKIDPDARLGDLGIASRHMVAIARALSIEARVVVLDEPTAALSHKEIQELYALVETLKAQGKAICSSATSSTRSSALRTVTRCSATGSSWAQA